METAEAVRLIDDVYWMRDRIATAAAGLTLDQLQTSSPGTTRDLRGTLVHELDVEWSWRLRLQGAPPEAWGPDAELQPADYASVAALMDHWRRDEAEMRAWIRGFSPGDLAAPPAAGSTDSSPLAFFVLHIVMHAGQQFSEAAVLLTQAGRSPGDLDFLDFADARR